MARWRVRPLLVAGIAGVVAIALGALALLWPGDTDPRQVDVGSWQDVVDRLDESDAPIEYGEQGDPVHFYVSRYPASSVPDGLSEYPAELRPALRAGLLALDPHSPRHGVRVAWCSTSQWFEDPAYGDKFNAVGEHVDGEARRGLGLFPLRIDDDRVVVDTSRVIPGVPAGTDTVRQAAQGPTCVG